MNSTVAVNLVEPGTMFGERLNVLDLRVNKLLRVAGKRLSVGVDLYNALNSNTVLSQNNTFAVPPGGGIDLARADLIVTPRFAKFNVSFDF